MSTNEIIRRLNELAQQVENNMVATYHGESGIDPDRLPEWQDRVASFQSLMEEAMEHLEAACGIEEYGGAMNDTLTRMAGLQAEAQRLLRKVEAERESVDFFSHERIHLDLAVQRLESAVWALGQTETGYILGRDFGREASHAS